MTSVEVDRSVRIPWDVADLLHPMSRQQYDALVDIGEFGPDDRFELLEGFLVGASEREEDVLGDAETGTVEIPGDVLKLLHPITRRQYDSLIEMGLFGPEDRIELLEGFLITMSPQDPRHSSVVIALTELLIPLLPSRRQLRTQAPFAVSDGSEPEPDLAVVPRADYGRRHPREALLVIEVANTSRGIDLGSKARVYAAAGVTEYWVVDVINDVVFRHLAPTGAGYAELTEHTGGRLRSTAVPEVEVDLDALLAR